MEAYEKMGVKSRRYHEKPVPVAVTSGSDFTVPLKILNMEHRLREGMKLVEKIRRKVTTSEPGATFRKILSFIADAVLALIYWPFLAASISFVYVIRFIVQFFFSNSKKWKGYRLVSGADALFGYKAENGSSLIHTATIVQGAPDYEAILSRYNNSVFKFRENNSKKNSNGPNIYCKLKQILSFKFGFYCWRDGEENFDIAHHVKFYKGNDEENNNNNNNNTQDNGEEDDIVTEDKLMDILSKLVSEDLPDSRPQWEHLIIPKFKFDHESESSIPQHFVCVFRIHHAYADGGSLGIFMDTVMADEPLKFAINPYEPFPGVSRWMNVLSYVNMFVKGPADFVRTLKSAVLDQSKFFVKSYSPKKVTAWSDPIDMDTLRDIKRISGGASVPSILLSCITASLKNQHVRLFSSRNDKNSINTPSSVHETDSTTSSMEAIPKTINIGTMSVMLPYENLQLQNHFTTFTLNCPLDESCSVERLRKTNKSCRLSSYSSEPRYNYFVMGLLGNCPKFIQDFFLEIAGTPLIFSNVPGVVEPMKVFGGTLVDTGVWLPHIRAYGMAIATYSYCGKIRICLTADSKIFHSSLQAKEFLKDAQKELDKLANSYEKCKGCSKL